MNEGAFFQDLALLMAVAGLVSAVFSRFQWPKVIGYIAAGVLLSRHTWGTSLLADESSVMTVAQLGIVFLMFSLGLEFSASGMKRIKNVTMPTAIFDMVVMIWLGYTVARNFFGWDSVPSLFLGAAICDSSTTVLAKIIDEMKWSKRPFVKYVLGTSVCEDIMCIGVIALITGVAQGRGMSLSAFGTSVGGLALFFLSTVVFGLVFVPRLLSSVAKRGDDEALLLTVLGCCFLVSYIAFRLDYSLALGAFLVGVLGSSSDVRRRLHALASPLRSMFAAMFFVSIGLLVDPSACWRQMPAIVLISAVVLAGKFSNCTIAAIFCGQSIKTSVQMGFALAQIGEFAYMVAILYLTLSDDPSSPMFQIVVGVSLLTTIMNPVMLRLSDPVGDWLEHRCPVKLHRALDAYRATLAKLLSTRAIGERRNAVRTALIELVVFFVLEFAVAVALSMPNGVDCSDVSVFFDSHKRIILCLGFNVFSVSMFVPVVAIARRLGAAFGEILFGRGGARWRQALDGIVRLFVLVLVAGLFFLEMTMFNVNLAPSEPWVKWLLFVVFTVSAGIGWRFFLHSAHRAGERLSAALASGDDDGGHGREELKPFTIPPDAVQRLVIGPGSPAIGGTVVTLDIRAKTGASVVSIWRDGEMIGNPGPGFEFRTGDEVGVLGEASQIAALKDLLGVVS